MIHDSAYFRRRAAELRSSASHKDDDEDVEVAGHLALAYAALARRLRNATTPADETAALDPAAASAADPSPLMLRD